MRRNNKTICTSIFEKTLQELTAKHRVCFPGNTYFSGFVSLDDTGWKTLWWTLIIDTKYYGRILSAYYGKPTLDPAHLYQIFSYVKNMDRENTGDVSGLLLYAKTGEELFPEGELFVIGGNSIGAKTLGLDQEFDLIAKQLDRIVEEYFVSWSFDYVQSNNTAVKLWVSQL